MNFLIETLNLTNNQVFIVLGAVFLAGLVRGFAGFALSAILMASIVTIIPPIELIPVCFMLEAAASFAMFRGGIKNADMSIVWVLVIGSAIGTPIGLLATTTIDRDLSRLIALCLILTLTAFQLFRIRSKFLATKPGLYASGLSAGLATGLASVGGMVVALYVLARDSAAKEMRGSLVMYLFLGMISSFCFLVYYDMLNMQAVHRSMILVPVVLFGVFMGSLFFRPSLEQHYKRFCLVLLIGLCLVGLAQQLT